MNKKQLTALYKISRPTLNKWLKKIGVYEKSKHIFTPKEMIYIVDRLGDPE